MSVNNVKTSGTASPNVADLGKSEKANAVKPRENPFAKTAALPSASEAANVQISPKARELSQAKKIVDETPDVRADKIAHFKELIAKGEYKPDAGKIADGIMREAIKDELSKTPEVALEE